MKAIVVTFQNHRSKKKGLVCQLTLPQHKLDRHKNEQVVFLPCLVACFHCIWIRPNRQTTHHFEHQHSTRSRTYHGYLLIHQVRY